jgi:D-alanyl-D-alanine carboxypeptidase (penicillin-binding protein 5/6)
VVEYPSGRVLFEKNARQRLAMASTTKIMTALLTLQRTRLTDTVTIVADDLVGESTMGLWEGETHTVQDLLYGLMLPSGNDAAMALARHVGGGLTEPEGMGPVARFIALMNRTAQQMGLADTHFANPHGFDDTEHYSSPYDLASLTWYAFHDPEFNKVVGTQFYDAPNHSLKNTNEMLSRYEGADGVKTGWTGEAGLCLVSSATRGDRRMIAVVLNALRWWDDSTALLDYGFAQPPAAPQTPGPIIDIAYRAQLLWFLANGLPTPLPVPPTPAPIPSPTEAVLAAGGGNMAQEPGSNPDMSVAPPAEPVTEPIEGAAPVPDPLAESRQPITLLPWVLAALLLVFLIVFVRGRLVRPRAAPVPATGVRSTATVAAAPPAPPPAQAVAPTPEPPRPQPAAARVSDPPSGASPSAGPRDPRPWRVSLLAHDDPALHAQRAVAMAVRGYEGSSLAEFLMTLDIDPDFEFSTIDGFYDMPAPGYLALAQAYAKRERPHYARALLRLALEQYPDDPYLAHFLHSLDAK